MELQKVREFLVLAEVLNFSRAAARLMISQPALSRHIRELETQLGTQLIIRDSNSLVLTEAGLKLQKDGVLLAGKADSLLKEMRRINAEHHASLHVGFISGVMNEDVVMAMQNVRAEFPDLTAHLYELGPTAQLERLAEGRLDVAVIGQAASDIDPLFDLFFVGRLTLKIILPETSPLARRKLIDIHELKGMPFIGMDEKLFPGRNDYMTRICRIGGFRPEFVAYADGNSSLMSLAAANNALTMAPYVTARIPHPGLVYRRMNTELAYVDSHAAITRGESRPVVRKFLNYLRMKHEQTEEERERNFRWELEQE